jgi:hypothetical protein
MSIHAAAQAEVNKLKTYFADALGADAILPSNDSGRPYVKVAEVALKDQKVILYANAAIETFPHVMDYKGKPRKVLTVGVVMRFAQQGGLPDTFNPPLHPRKGIVGGFRLSKHAFPVCVAFGVDTRKAWLDQNVSEQLVKWLQTVAEMAGAKPIDPSLLKMVVEQALPQLELPEGADKLFSLDTKNDAVSDFDPEVAALVTDGEQD